MPPRHRLRGAPVPPALVGMAAGRSCCSELSLMVRQLGMWSQLDKAAHRQLRLVCRALHAEADALIDTLALRLDNAACSPAAAQRIAAFHRRCTAAQTLHIYLPGGASITSDMVRCAEAYARAAGPALLGVQQSQVSGAGCGRHHVAVLRSLLGALPQLQGLSLMASGSGASSELHHTSPSSADQLLSGLSACAQLRSLVLDYNPDRDSRAGIMTALQQLTQLHALSLTGRVVVGKHLRHLTGLTRLERLGVGALATHGNDGDEGTPGVQLPSVRSLSAAWTDPLPPPPPQPAYSSSMSSDTPCSDCVDPGADLDYVDTAALGALPNLQRVERMAIGGWNQDVLSAAAHLPALVQRFAGCADLWRLIIDPRDALPSSLALPALKEQLLPGSLAALRHLQVGCLYMSPNQSSAFLQLLLDAAPNIRSLVMRGVYLSALASDHTLLQPYKHAAQLQMLLFDAYNVSIDAPQLASMVRYLAAPPQELRAAGTHCAALRCVLVRHWRVDGMVDAAAALLEESGCTIRLQRLI